MSTNEQLKDIYKEMIGITNISTISNDYLIEQECNIWGILSVTGNVNINSMVNTNINVFSDIQSTNIDTSIIIANDSYCNNITSYNIDTSNVKSDNITSTVQILIDNMITTTDLSTTTMNITSTSLLNNKVYSDNILCENLTTQRITCVYNTINDTYSNSLNIDIINISTISNINNFNIDGNINISGTLNISNDITLTGINISGNANITNFNIVNLTLLSNISCTNIIIDDNLYFSGGTCSIGENSDNIPLWGFYREGGIIKTKIPDIIPIITLVGDTSVSMIEFGSYVESGLNISFSDSTSFFTTTSYINGVYQSGINHLSDKIEFTNSDTITELSSLIAGDYDIIYDVIDNYGVNHTALKNLTVIADSVLPQITLLGDTEVLVIQNETYMEAGVSVSDDNTIDYQETIGAVDTATPGVYDLEYRVYDLSGNVSSVTRKVYVIDTSEIGYYDFSLNNLAYLSLTYTDKSTLDYFSTKPEYAIECDIFVTSFVGSNNILQITDAATGGTSIVFYIDSEGKLVFRPGSGIDLVTISTFDIELNKWIHVRAEYLYNHIIITKDYIYSEARHIRNPEFHSLIRKYGILDTIYLGTTRNWKDVNSGSNKIKGSISNLKIYSNYTLKFHLGNNFIDNVSGQTLQYNTVAPIIRPFPVLPTPVPTDVIQTNLVFHLKPTEIGAGTWSNNGFNFIPQTVANDFSSIIYKNNNNAWGTSGNFGWMLDNKVRLSDFNWSNGFSLEQWILVKRPYVDDRETFNSFHLNANDYGKMCLVGQTSFFGTNDYSIHFYRHEMPYHLYYFDDNIQIGLDEILYNQGNGLPFIRLGQRVEEWIHIVIATSSSQTVNKDYKLYVNGELVHNMTDGDVNTWPNPALSSSTFTIGCSSVDGFIMEAAKNNIFYGETLLYNKILTWQEIKHNYIFNSSKYPLDVTLPRTLDIDQVGYTSINGSLAFKGNFNRMVMSRTWYLETWFNVDTTSKWVRLLQLFSGFGRTQVLIGITDGKLNINNNTSNNFSVAPGVWYHMVAQSNMKEILIAINGTAYYGRNLPNAYNYNSSFSSLYGGSYAVARITTQSPGTVRISGWKLSLGTYFDYESNNNYNYPFTPPFYIPHLKDDIIYIGDNLTDIVSNTVGVLEYGYVEFVPGTNAATLVLNGEENITLYKNINTYTELGARVETGLFRIENAIATVSGTVDNTTFGLYKIVYSYENAIKVRYVRVIDYDIPPVMTLNGPTRLYVGLNETFNDPSATGVSGESLGVVISNEHNIDVNTVGKYDIVYTGTDDNGNKATISREVYVVDLPISDIFFWLNASISDGKKDIVSSKNFIDNQGTTSIASYEYRGNKFLDLTSSSLKSENQYAKSLDVTFFIVMENKSDVSNGCIFGHFNDNTTEFSLVNKTSENILISSTDENTKLSSELNNLVLCIGVINSGTYLYYRQINLETGLESNIATTLNSTTMNTSNADIFIGSLASGGIANCYIGEVIYSQTVMDFEKIKKIEYFLFNKWANQYACIDFTSVSPQITLSSTELYVKTGRPYTELGAELFYPFDKSLTVTITGSVDINTPGTYVITYSATNKLNDTDEKTRNIIVTDPIPVGLFEITPGTLIELNNVTFDALNSSDWTVEIWVFLNVTGVIDVIELSSTQNSDTYNFQINASDKPILKSSINGTEIGNNTTTIYLNKWVNICWMRLGSNIYTFINGEVGSGTSVPSYLNSLSNVNVIKFGKGNNTGDNNFMIGDALISTEATHTIATYTPLWRLAPTSNDLFEISYNIDTVSAQVIDYTPVTFTFESPILPIITPKALNPFYVRLNGTANDYGATSENYITGATNPVSITSVKDSDNNELLIGGNLDATVKNTLGFINTSTAATYTINYRATDINGTKNFTKSLIVSADDPYVVYTDLIDTINYTQTLNLTSTFELWLKLSTSGTNDIFVTDLFTISVDDNDDVLIDSTVLTTTIKVPIDEWFHLAVVLSPGSSAKCFIGGKTTGSVTYSYTQQNMNSVRVGYTSSGIIFSQPTITNIVKYDSDFLLSWDLYTNTSDIIYSIYSDIEIKSDTIITSNSELFTSIPVKPTIALVGDVDIKVNRFSKYADPGVNAEYILEITSIPVYLISIIDDSTSTELIVGNNYILITTDKEIPEIDTSDLVKTYTLTYKAEASNGSFVTITRNISIIDSNLAFTFVNRDIPDINTQWGSTPVGTNMWFWGYKQMSYLTILDTGTNARTFLMSDDDFNTYTVNTLFTNIPELNNFYIERIMTAANKAVVSFRNNSVRRFYFADLQMTTYTFIREELTISDWRIHAINTTELFFYEKNHTTGPIYYSTDPLEFGGSITAPILYNKTSSTYQFRSVAVGNGLTLISFYNHSYVLSSDNTNWVEYTDLNGNTPPGGFASGLLLSRIYFMNGLFIAVVYYNDITKTNINGIPLFRSSNGVDWIMTYVPLHPDIPTTSVISNNYNFGYINSTYVIVIRYVNPNGKTYIAYSPSLETDSFKLSALVDQDYYNAQNNFSIMGRFLRSNSNTTVTFAGKAPLVYANDNIPVPEFVNYQNLAVTNIKLLAYNSTVFVTMNNSVGMGFQNTDNRYSHIIITNNNFKTTSVNTDLINIYNTGNGSLIREMAAANDKLIVIIEHLPVNTNNRNDRNYYMYVFDDYSNLASPTLVTPEFNIGTLLAPSYYQIRAFSENMFIAMSRGGSTFYTSSDGISWSTQYTFPSTFFETTRLTFAYFDNKYYVATGNAKYGTSTDFITWTVYDDANNSIPPNYAFGKLKKLNGKLLWLRGNRNANPGNIITSDNGIRLLTSDDGLTWTSIIIPYYDSIDNPPTHNITIYEYGYVSNRYVFIFYSNVYGYYNVVSEDLVDFFVNLPSSSSMPVTEDDGKYFYRNASAASSIASAQIPVLKYLYN